MRATSHEARVTSYELRATLRLARRAARAVETLREEVHLPAMPSTVYGPVRSWRYGNSLGVDLLYTDSICSFNCVYCQLGEINQIINEQRLFVPTPRVIEDLSRVDMNCVDFVTLSGNGEPTLALNIGEVIEHVREAHNKPVLVLTNSTWLYDGATRERLMNASIIECKLDASNEEMLARVNKPAPGVSLARIIDGIRLMRHEPRFTGKLTLQCMLLTAQASHVEELARIVRDIAPDEVQINTPLRPKPEAWFHDARGNHGRQSPVPAHQLRTITPEEAGSAAAFIRTAARVSVRTVFDR